VKSESVIDLTRNVTETAMCTPIDGPHGMFSLPTDD
jgi:hypothetical protein